MLRSSAIGILSFFMLAGSAPMAHAQETGVAGELERIASATPAERLEYSDDALEEMRESVKTASRLMEAARRDGLVDELQCLSKLVTPLRSLLQVSESADTAMRTAMADGATARADQEFRKIAVALTKSRQLASEAGRCMDSTALQSGDTVTSWQGPATAGDDSIDPGFTPFDLGFDPPESSPFM